MKKKYPVQMDWAENTALGYKLPIYYDHYLEIVDSFHGFIYDLAKRKTTQYSEDYEGYALESGIDAPARHMKAYLEFLCLHDLDWMQATEDTLIQFRDWERERVLAKPYASGDGKKASETVNLKLKTIYQFYGWAQTLAGYLTGCIGMGAQFNIKSTVADEYKITGILRLPNSREGGMSEDSRYPILFMDTGGHSDTEVGYVATTQDFKHLRDYFNNTYSPVIARRNILIMQIASQVGWRRGSINSLETTDITQAMIDQAEAEGRDAIRVTPSKQKFNYKESFDVSLALAQVIVNYINDDDESYPGRAGLLRQVAEAKQKREDGTKGEQTSATKSEPKAVSEDVHENSIFLNSVTGEPLADETITNHIFGPAFQAIGAPRGAGIHSFRRKFAEEEIELQYKTRKEKKLPNSMMDIMVPVAKKLGQKKYTSPGKYIRKINEDVRNSQRAKDKELVKEQEIMLVETEQQIHRLTHHNEKLTTENETLQEKVKRLERENEALRRKAETRKRR